MSLKNWIWATVGKINDVAYDIDDQVTKLGIAKVWLQFAELNSHEMQCLEQTTDAVLKQRATKEIFPDHNEMHRWSYLCTPDDVKVVIIGQDPYPDNRACGIAFSCKGTNLPASLCNIFYELSKNLEFTIPECGDLEKWCTQGVLLLNTILTVEKGNPLSHANMGWQRLTFRIIQNLAKNKHNLVFMLWGSYAKTFGAMIDRKKHLVLESGHPSPRATAKVAFVGSNQFIKANEYLQKNGKTPIDWNILTK